MHSMTCIFVVTLFVLVVNNSSSLDDITTPSPAEFKKKGLFFWLLPRHHIRYLLWTRENDSKPYELKTNDFVNLQRSNFNASNPLKIIFHGYGNDGDRFLNILILKAGYVSRQAVNVITVDYPRLVPYPSYYMAASNIDLVAEESAKFLDFLSDFVPLENMHMIGHSLGCHAAGLTGQLVRRGRIGRITGLDPAGPGFQFVSDDSRLSKDDAIFVDIIHTGGANVVIYGFGIIQPIGDIDVYPNGGKFQPGCSESEAEADILRINCCHLRAIYLYLESLFYPGNLVACKCPNMDMFTSGKCQCTNQDLIHVGDDCNSKSKPGTYYLTTGKEFPYGNGNTEFSRDSSNSGNEVDNNNF